MHPEMFRYEPVKVSFKKKLDLRSLVKKAHPGRPMFIKLIATMAITFLVCTALSLLIARLGQIFDF